MTHHFMTLLLGQIAFIWLGGVCHVEKKLNQENQLNEKVCPDFFTATGHISHRRLRTESKTDHFQCFIQTVECLS